MFCHPLETDWEISEISLCIEKDIDIFLSTSTITDRYLMAVETLKCGVVFHGYS